MKTTILIVLTVIATLMCQTASADRRHSRGYDRQHDYGFRGSNYSYGYNRGNYYNFSYGRRHHGDHFSTGSFLGGLVLGSVLTAPRYSNRRYEDTYYRRTPVRRSSQVVVVNQGRPSNAVLTPQRRLLRDLEGRCYQIVRSENGDEIRTELEPESCNF
jgi:hypothetical protein